MLKEHSDRFISCLSSDTKQIDGLVQPDTYEWRTDHQPVPTDTTEKIKDDHLQSMNQISDESKPHLYWVNSLASVTCQIDSVHTLS